MSSTLEPMMWSCVTGQRMPCFDSCRLTVKWISNMKLTKAQTNVQPRSIIWSIGKQRAPCCGRSEGHALRPQANAAHQDDHEKKKHGFPISMHGFLWFAQFLQVCGFAPAALRAVEAPL